MLCILYPFWSLIGLFFVFSPSFSLAGTGFMLQSQWHWVFYHHKDETLNAQDTVCIWHCALCPHETCHSLVHGIQVHGYFVRLARATWCWGERLRDLDGWRHWRDGVCSRDERETAGSWVVGLFLFHPWAGGQRVDTEDERWWREREQESEERADTSRKRLRKRWGGEIRREVFMKAGWIRK